MPTADLRALGGTVGLLKPCDCYGGCERCDIGNRGHGERWRLPTEAEVRAAIFEAGGGFVEIGVDSKGVGVEVSEITKTGEERYASTADAEAKAGEATPEDDLVLLALLRALEAARDGR